MQSGIGKSFAVLMALIASACQTYTPPPTTEPLTELSYATVKAYHAYRIAIGNYPHHHMVFALDPERGKVVWLGRKRRLGVGFAAQEALKICRKDDPAVTCRILDIDGTIVWVGVNDDLRVRLLTDPHIKVGDGIPPYTEKELVISDHQKQAFSRYKRKPLPQDSSAFFISIDRVSSGAAFSTGRGRESRSNVLRDAKIRCEVNSGGKKCYVFAANGEPVNNDAKMAISRQ